MNRRPRPTGPLRLGTIPKHADTALQDFFKRIRFFGHPFEMRVVGWWYVDTTATKHRPMLHLEVHHKVVDILDRRKGGRLRFIRTYAEDALPSGRYVSEKFLLNEVRDMLKWGVVHELDECFLFKGHRVFNPHTQTGRKRVTK